MKKVKNEYVSNKKFYEVLKEYKLQYTEFQKGNLPDKPVIPEYIGQCLLLIATRLAKKPNFSGYSYKDEMISDGYENCIVYLHSFNPDKSTNPFAYFTTVVFNSFRRRINNERRQQYYKMKSMQNFLHQEQIWEDTTHSIRREQNDVADEFIKNFEKSAEEKKKKMKVGVERFIDKETKE